MSNEDEEDMNLPDMDKVAYDVAIEAMAKMFNDLRATGMERYDAAAIVAAVIKGADGGNQS